MKLGDSTLGRQIAIPGMAYAPTTESAVVFLFGLLARRLGFCVETVRPQFPDCIAVRRGKRCRIEFELRASEYQNHRHPPRGADIIVCWENDWEYRPAKYRHLEIISLKERVGATPRVLVVGCIACNDHELEPARVEWNVPRNSQVDDLVIMYRAMPKARIEDAWKVVGPMHFFKKNNRQDRWPGYQAGIKRLVRFDVPVTYRELARDPQTRDLTIVQMKFRGKMDITDDWPILAAKTLKLNPRARLPLQNYIDL